MIVLLGLGVLCHRDAFASNRLDEIKAAKGTPSKSKFWTKNTEQAPSKGQ